MGSCASSSGRVKEKSSKSFAQLDCPSIQEEEAELEHPSGIRESTSTVSLFARSRQPGGVTPGRQLPTDENDRLPTGIETRLTRNYTGIAEVQSTIFTDDENDLLCSSDDQQLISFGAFNEQTEEHKLLMQVNSIGSQPPSQGRRKDEKKKKKKKKNVRARTVKNKRGSALDLPTGYAADSSNKDGSGFTAEEAGGFVAKKEECAPIGLPPRAPKSAKGHTYTTFGEEEDYPLPLFDRSHPSTEDRHSAEANLTPLGNSEMRIAVQCPTLSQHTSNTSGGLTSSEKRDLEEAEDELHDETQEIVTPARNDGDGDHGKPPTRLLNFVNTDKSVCSSLSSGACGEETAGANPLSFHHPLYFDPDRTASNTSEDSAESSRRASRQSAPSFPHRKTSSCSSGQQPTPIYYDSATSHESMEIGPARTFPAPVGDSSDSSFHGRAQLFRVTTNGSCTFDFDI